MVIDGDDLWVRGEDDFLTRVDARSGRIVERVTADVGGGDVLVAFGSVWASASDDGIVFRVPMR